ncbi:MAG: hypothetical protein QOD69_2313 [Solirubrobacteraceae bacterium]|nr:hypothetical protein [Solirubrobacteraceae bacterium]
MTANTEVDMNESADRSPGRTTHAGAEHGRFVSVGDELARLRGRTIGACASCGRAVFLENFTRFRGRVVHVRCPIAADLSTPRGPQSDGAARQS